MDIQVYTGATGITPKFETSSIGGVFELKISQIGFSIFNIPPRCMRSQINVYLPQQFGGTLAPNTIQVKNQDITMMGNDIPYQQDITLITSDGDVNLNGIRAQKLNIRTDDGDILGSITSISNELNISTDDGDLNLTLGNAQTPFTSKFTIATDDGDVELKFVSKNICVLLSIFFFFNLYLIFFFIFNRMEIHSQEITAFEQMMDLFK